MKKDYTKLIKKSIKGDDSAFSLIFLDMQNKLYRIAYSRLKSESDTQDAIQNTIVNVYENLGNLKNFSSFEAWSTRILINECNKIYADKKKIFLSEDNILEFNSYEDNHNDLIFNNLIKNLTTKEQLVLTLYYKNNLDINEISDKLNLNTNTIKSILHRSRNKIKKYLED